MSISWRGWCEDESMWIYKWSDTEITQCPNDTNHTLRVDSVSAQYTKKLLVMVDIDADITNTVYTLAKSFSFPGSNLVGNIHSITTTGYIVDAGVTSFDIKVRDTTHDQTIAEITNLTATTPTNYNLGAISSVPAGPSSLEVHVRKTGGNSKKIAHVSTLSLFVEHDY